MADHEKMVESLQTERANAHEQHQTLTTQCASLERTVADQAAELAAMSNEKTTLNTKAQSLAAQRVEAVAACQDVQAIVQERDGRIEVLEAVIDKLSRPQAHDAQ